MSSATASAGTPTSTPAARPSVALVGNPNCGKTTLFNRLTGLRAHTANFPGTTVEHRHGPLKLPSHDIELVDLPGLYSLDALSPEERVACEVLNGKRPKVAQPKAVIVVVDATNLERNLFLVSQVAELTANQEMPMLVALNMSDIADKHGLQINQKKLTSELGCPVVSISARTGQGIDELLAKLDAQFSPAPALPQVTAEPASCGSCRGCGYSERYAWAERVARSSVRGAVETVSEQTERIDSVLTHPVGGLVAFAAIMFATFWLIFSLATLPMGFIELLFEQFGEIVGRRLPEGDLQSLLVDGVIGGVGGILVFLPQICILFFMLALIEDSGYLARAAFVMDRLMHRVGLPGKAFVPMLSAHACALPAIMSTRVIEDRRDRLAAILVIPLMTCSARVPVYTMVTMLLFPNSQLKAALLFVAAYSLGIVAALVSAWCIKRTILPGATRPLVIELPNYRLPSLRTALLTTLDRAWVFIRNAGTTILVISLIMWAAATYPKTELGDLPAEVQAAHAELASTDEAAAEALLAQEQLEHSAAGRIGQAIQPAFAPLGFDWKMSIGILSSFAAREVIVSNLGILYGLGDVDDDTKPLLYDTLRASRHADGSPVFTVPTCLSLLVFFVLAMQCLPTQAVTKRETGSWKWAFLQLGYMSVLAYVAALVTYQLVSAFA